MQEGIVFINVPCLVDTRFLQFLEGLWALHSSWLMAEDVVSGFGVTMAEYDYQARSELDLRRRRMLVYAGLKHDVGPLKAG